VGIRDEAKYLGGIAPCGRVCCCAGNIPEFKKVSVKMAKTQGLSLNPGKISGLCGRLMCCLSYENDYYAEASKKMPKVNSEVGTPEGKAFVVSVNMLKMQVKVKIDDKNGGWIYKDYPVSDIRFKKANMPEKEEKEDDLDILE
jgi:cell fate regulator YaaT (PSP1 superfamily)